MGDTRAGADVFDAQPGRNSQALNVSGGKQFVHAGQHICKNALGSIAFLQTDSSGVWCDYLLMNLGQEDARRLLNEMVKATGLTLTEIARNGGLAPSTLTRFFNKPDVKHTLSMKSAQKAASGNRLTLILAIDAAGQRSPDEARLLTVFRALPDTDQQSLLVFSEALAQRQAAAPIEPAPAAAKRGRR
jgi:hypothetical protein